MNEIVGGIIGGGFNLINGILNRNAQAEENEKVRQFNAEEAVKQRDWQERMYNDYQSPQAQVAQRMAAGLNPTEGVTSQSVGNGSTASSSSSSLPPVPSPISPTTIAELGLIKSQKENFKAQAEKTKQEALTEYYNTILKAKEAGNFEEFRKAQLKLLDEQSRQTGYAADIAKEQKSMLESFVADGGNTYQDESNLKQSEAFNNTVSAMRTQLLALSEKQRIESETQLNNLAYELEDTFGRRIKSALAQSSESELEKLKIDLREYIANSKIRRELVTIGLSDAKADLFAKQLSNTLESIDLNTIRSIVGDGSDPRSVFYGIFKKFFADMP